MSSQLPPQSCPICGLIMPDGHEPHWGAEACVVALRAAMLAQRKAAESLGLTISTRFLAVLEELSLRPEVVREVEFKICDPEGRVYAVPPDRVSGVFAAIRHLYEGMGDWSPLRQAEKDAETARADALLWARRAGLLDGLFEVMATKYHFDPDDRAKVAEIMFQLPGS